MATATKRKFLMLSHTRDDDDSTNIAGWFMSEKLDGQRVLWDGGLTRGLHVADVPFANTEKDARYIDQKIIATGLWSRNAKVIRAPSWFLDNLPNILLDGEIFSGRRKWERTSEIIKDIIPNEADWKEIQYYVFDSPPLDVIFQPGMIVEEGSVTYTIDMTGVYDWALKRANELKIIDQPNSRAFEFVLGWLKKQNIENEYVHILEQVRLPYSTAAAVKMIDDAMTKVIAIKGEGLMVRKPESLWSPERIWNLMKIKPWYTAEGTVVGYTWGKETKKGSKHLGKMGAMIIRWEGKEFEISGFKDNQRLIYFETGGLASDIGRLNPGGRVPQELTNPIFPKGLLITFRYRDVSANGIPKNANYDRTPVDL